MKLEIGMYVRNEDGYILKLNEENIYGYKSLIGGSNLKIKSYNIIDLIGVGDYVNGNEVMAISEFKDGSRYIEFDEENYLCKNYQIKSILTKEQFESMEYRFGD